MMKYTFYKKKQFKPEKFFLKQNKSNNVFYSFILLRDKMKRNNKFTDENFDSFDIFKIKHF